MMKRITPYNFQKSFAKFIRPFWGFFIQLRLAILSAGYFFHLWVRMLHDKTYEKIPVYKNYSDKKYTSTVHKTVLVSFVVSFVLFILAQNVLPGFFSLQPSKVKASTNSKTWTTNGDFAYNKSSLCGATTQSNVVISGAAYTDGTCAAADADANVKLAMSAAMPSNSTFGTGGVVISNPNVGFPDTGQGAVIVGNYIYVSGKGNASWRIEKRLLSDGSLVTGFGTGGAVVSTLTQSNGDITSIATDGTNLYLGGYDNYSFDTQWRIEKRLLSDGSLVSGFGTGGVLTSNPTSGNDKATSIAVDGTNLIVAGIDSTGGNEWRLEKRLLSDGSLVSGFGTGGVITSNPSTGSDVLNSITTDGVNLYAAGFDASPGNAQWHIEKRLLSDGSLVTGFGTGGVITSNPSTGDDVLNSITTDGVNLYTAGYDYSPGNAQWHIEKRLLSDGSLVTGFGTGGVITSNPSTGDDRVNKIVTDGSSIYSIGYDSAAGAADTEWRIQKNSSTFTSPGTVSGLKVDAGTGAQANWSVGYFAVTTALPTNTSVTLSVRTAATSAGLSTATFYDMTSVTQISANDSNCTAISSASNRVCYSGNIVGAGGATVSSEWVEARVSLATSDGASTPTLDGIKLSYNFLEAPTNPKQYKSDNTEINIANTNGYTNETSANLKVDIPNMAGIPSETLTPQIELVSPSSAAFSSPATSGSVVPAGVTYTPTNVSYTLNTAAPGSAIGLISGLTPGNSYKWQVRLTDSSGRLGSWSSANNSFTVDQVTPTLTSISLPSAYTQNTSTAVTITGASDADSKLSKLFLTNNADNTGWVDVTNQITNYQTVFVGQSSFTGTVPWTLSSGDGAKNVSAKVVDNAGNTTGKIFTSQADLYTGKTVSNLDGASVPGDLKLTSNAGSVTPDYGTGAQGDVTITGTHNINEYVTGYNPPTTVPNFNNLTISTGAVLTTSGPSGANPGTKLEFKVKGTLTIQGTGKISADAAGYPGGVAGHMYGYGPGGGICLGGGGSYGGAGGGGTYSGSTCAGGVSSTYAYATDPFGSGGSGNGDGIGSAGGGAIKIQTQSVSFNGSITSNGAAGVYSAFGGGGGASGGSIYIITSNVVANTGSLQANGGASASGNSNNPSGGGGGRIIVQSPATFTGTMSGGTGVAAPGQATSGGVVNISAFSPLGTLGETGTALQYDAGVGVTQKWNALSWSADTLATGQAIKYMVSNDQGTTWRGPNGNAGDWNTNYFGQAFGGSAITSLTNIPASRYLYIKIQMSSSGNDTPVLHDLSILSASAATTTLDAAPPTNFSLSSPSNNLWQSSATPTLAWNAATDAGSGIQKYQLFVDTVLNRDNISSVATSTTPASSLTEGTHTWYIKAFDNAGNSTNSTETWTVGYDATPPAAPQSFSVTGAVSTITLAWSYANNTGSPISSVRAERIDWGNYDPLNPNADWSAFASYHVKTYAGDSTGAVYSVSDIDPDTKVTQGKKYAYRISAKDAVNAAWGTNSAVQAGLTQDSIFDATVQNVTVAPCDGTLNCSVNPSIRHKGFETKITWGPAIDSGVGTSHYLIYRSTQILNAGNYSDPNVRSSYQIVGVLPYQTGQSPVWYDNDANNDGITTFYDGNGNPIVISSAIQALTTKTVATSRLSDYSLYYYRVVGVDLNNNKSPIFNESPTPADFDVLKAFQNGNQGTAAERTPDVTPPSVPLNVNPVATGIDDLNSTPDPTQGMMISWDFSTDNSGRAVTYKLYQATGDSVGPITWNPTPIYTGTNTSYQQKGLAQNSYYYFRVTAQDPDNNVSANSNYTGTVTKNSQVPTTPTFVTIRAVTGDPVANNRVGKDINVQFNGSTIRYSANTITGYEVYRSTTNYSTDAQWLSSATNVKTYSGLNFAGYDGTLGPGSYDITRNFTDTVSTDATTFYYRVRAIGQNSSGVVQSGLSSIQTATLNYGWDTTPDVTAPVTPPDLTVKDIHDDGMNFKRNIVTWARIATPARNGANDFLEYRIYRSLDGVVWNQICQNGTNTIMIPACTTQYPNPLYKSDKEQGLANNYFMDLIPIASANQNYSYYVTAVDDAGINFKYPNGTIINAYNNESAPSPSNNPSQMVVVSINPAITHTTILAVNVTDPTNPCSQFNGLKACIVDAGVSSATISWTTDQVSDSVVEFKRHATNDPYLGVIDRMPVYNHSVTIKPLLPNTAYDYQVTSRNSLKNDTVASGTDLPPLTTTGFNITPGTVVTTTSTAEVNWTTNLDASSAFVEYQLQRLPGDDPQSGTTGVSTDALAATPRTHKVIIKGLRSGRTYTYKIKSISKDGFLAEFPTGSFSNFRTQNFDSAAFSLAPASSNVADKNITSTTAQIVWQTGNPATSWVDYGTASNQYSISAGDNGLNTTHVVTITGLIPGTKYFYHVRSKDANELEFTSQEYSFTAVIKPKISNLQVKNISPYSATIAWDTNVETETVLNWGTSANYGEKHGTGGTSQVHQVTIDNLYDNTEYHYQIVAHDSAGNEVVGTDAIIRTPLDTEGPKITGVKTDIMPLGDADTQAQVIVSWQTNKPSTTLVQYDEGIIGGRYTKASTEDTSLNNSHTVIVKGLSVATTYHYRIVTKDKRGNTTISNDYTFVTPAKEQSIWTLIVNSLQQTFAWTKNLGNLFKRSPKLR